MRARWARGARSPARADRALGRHDREDAGVEQRDERLDGLEPRAGAPAGEDVDAQRHESPGLGLAERIAHAGGVGAHEVLLQLAAGAREG